MSLVCCLSVTTYRLRDGAPAFTTPVIPTAIIPTPTIPTQVNESAKQQAMASVRFYERGINKDSKPPVMCVTGVDPRAEFFFANTPADHFFRLKFG